MRHKSIKTTYSGVEFRSRLEARWAAFFDKIGWRWVYEPYDLEGWIPDFLILGHVPLLVEVKPADSLTELLSLIEDAHLSSGKEVLIVGACPYLPYGNGFEFCWDRPSPGLLKEAEEVLFDPGLWCRCEFCRAPGIFSCSDGSTPRVCGHEEREDPLGELSEEELIAAWAEASNRSRWKRLADGVKPPYAS